jgi:hypothetical protein
MSLRRLGAAALVGALAVAVGWAALDRGETATATPENLQGSFASLTHRTIGRALLVRRADGARELRLTGFETRTAPDLFVYLIPRSAPGGEIAGGVKIASLRTPVGDSAYPVPAGLELGDSPTVVIWCAKCRVAFGSALLASAPV